VSFSRVASLAFTCWVLRMRKYVPAESAANADMMAMTTSSSISVNAERRRVSVMSESSGSILSLRPEGPFPSAQSASPGFRVLIDPALRGPFTLASP
jgi:hypothetical protein